MAYTRDIKAGRASVELTTKDKMQRGLARARARLQHFGQDVQAMGTTMMGAATGLLAPMAAALKTFSEIGDAAAKMARRTGLSGEAVQSLGFAAKRSGTDLESLEKGVRRMGRTIWDAERGLSTATDALGDLGLTIGDLQGKSPEEQFKAMADALGRVEDASRKSAIAQQIFGRSGTMLLPMFEKGRKGIETLQKKFEALGVTLSGEDLKAAETFTDTLGDLWTQVKYGVALLGSALVPAVGDLTKSAGDWLKEAATWIKENRDLIVQYGKLALSIGKWLAIVGGGLIVVGKLATGVAGLVGAFKALSAVLLTNPFTAVFAAAAVAGLAVYRLTSYTAQLAKEKERVLAVANRERAADLAKLGRLKAIQADHERTNAEIAEAKRLVDELEGKYGDLGLSVNEVTGEISGLAGALDKVEDVMRSIATIQIKEALAETQQNLAELRKETAAFWTKMREGWEGFWYDLATEGDEVRSASLDARMDQASALHDRIKALRAQMAALARGEKEGFTGGAKPGVPETAGPPGALGGAGAGPAGVEGLTERLQDRLHKIRIDQIEDEHARAVASINHRYDVERRRLEAQGATEEQLAALRSARAAELAGEQRRYEDELYERAKEHDQAMLRRQNERLNAEYDIRRQIRRAEIEATMEGNEKRLALLELERQAALRRAGETGASADLVNRLYDLRRQAMESAGGVERTVSTRGTFSARAANLAVGSVAERTAKAAEETAKNTKEMVRQARQGAGIAVTQ